MTPLKAENHNIKLKVKNYNCPEYTFKDDYTYHVDTPEQEL